MAAVEPFGKGDNTLFPVGKSARVRLNAYEGDTMRRVLVRPEDPSAVRSDEWTPTVDLRTGLAVAIRRADCGAGCRCAAEVKVL